ncbi:hypothetical protein [Rhodopseudomonas palustris]|uniref:hypothetical protein n=1 Tax=Rhodopseudomonas palustris TaxID=1076 RepID=UPI0012D38E64|nr:hypothetical protein [Rhodopseudomonas palustris]
MDHPTLSDVIVGEQECGCGHTHVVEPHERRYPIDTLMDRVAELEKRLGVSE